MILEIDNLYATPKSVLDKKYSEGEGVWRKKKLLVMDRTSTLPDRCIKCNTPTKGFFVEKNLYYYPPILTIISFLLFFVIGILIIIPLLIFRKRAKIMVGLCEHHRKRRINFLWIFGGFFILAIISFLVSGFVPNSTIESAIPLSVGGGALLISLIFVTASNISLFAKKIDDQHLWIRGVKPIYLQEFPELPE